jgi:hypothetical protein
MRSTRRVILASVVATVAFSLLAVGCGGGRSPSVAAVASSTSIATQSGTTTVAAGSVSGALAFARCMRSHGIPNWPDPTSDGGFDKSKLRQLGLSVGRVRAIERTSCNYYFVGGGPPETAQQSRIQLADKLSFARCMRSRGVSRFPDPTAQGELTLAMVPAQGIDIHAPMVLRVVVACLPASHGALTLAKVRHALNNPSG